MKRLLLTSVFAASFVFFSAPAFAQSHVGIRAGVSSDPGQFFFGGHVETNPLMKNLTFRPNVEIGLGDDITTVALNIEFAYWIPLDNKSWRLYVGGGPAANFYDTEGDSDVRGGFNLLVGGQHNGGLFVEFKVGLVDSPEVKFTVGYAFK
jgi:hypothetical protein